MVPIQRYWVDKGEGLMLFEKRKNELLFCINPAHGRYKIYRPESDSARWFSNCSSTDLMGLDSIDWLGDTLVLTKGMKELVTLRNLMYPSVALQGETNYPGIKLYQSLKYRFKQIYVLMDNDEIGTKASSLYRDKHQAKIIQVPVEEGVKDLAQYVLKYGLLQTDNLIREQL